MKKFGELGVCYKPDDGKKQFPGKVVPIRSIANKLIEIHDYESDLTTAHGEGRYLVSFRNKEDGFPFETTIVMDFYDNKTLPKFT